MNEVDLGTEALSALAHATRLDAFRRLVRGEPDGLSTGQLVEASGLTQSTFSSHLAISALVLSYLRSGAAMIQRANIEVLRDLMLFIAKDCCDGRAELCDRSWLNLPLLLKEQAVSDQPYNVLFLCTGNSPARSWAKR